MLLVVERWVSYFMAATIINLRLESANVVTAAGAWIGYRDTERTRQRSLRAVALSQSEQAMKNCDRSREERSDTGVISCRILERSVQRVSLCSTPWTALARFATSTRACFACVYTATSAAHTVGPTLASAPKADISVSRMSCLSSESGLQLEAGPLHWATLDAQSSSQRKECWRCSLE